MAFLRVVGVTLIVVYAALAVLAAYVSGFDREAAWVFIELGLFLGAALSFIFGGLWGGAAITYQHPLSDRGYREWLQASPWRPGLPLLRGPIRLTRRQFVAGLVFCSIAALAAWLIDRIPWFVAAGPFLAMLLGAAGALLPYNWLTGQHKVVYAALITAVVVVFFLPLWLAAVLVPVVTYLIGLAGARQAVREFPWPQPEEKAAQLGWPYTTMLSEPRETRCGKPEAALRGALAAAAIVCVFSRVPDLPAVHKDPLAFAMVICGVSAVLALVRFSEATLVVCPNLCWGERAGAGRWIIPRHDVLFAVPLSILAIGPGVTYLLPMAFGVPIYLAAAIAMGLAVYITFGVGPNVVDLFYTGRHAIEFHPPRGVQNRGKFVQVNT